MRHNQALQLAYLPPRRYGISAAERGPYVPRTYSAD